MPKRIGLEIGVSKTRILVGTATKKNYHVSGYKIIDTVEGVYGDDNTDISIMEKPIHDALKELGVKSAELHVSLNNEKIIIRTRELPRVSPKDMKSVVRFEAETFLPYDINEFYIDYKVLDEIEEETKDESKEKSSVKKDILFNVMIIAAPKDLVNQYIVLAKKLKLKLKVTTVYTESVSKYLRKNILTENKNALFVDIGYNFTNMIMYEGYKYFANTKSDLGIVSIKNNLINKNGFNEHDVELHMFSKDNTDSKAFTSEDKMNIIKSSITNTNDEISSKDKLRNLQKELQKIKKAKKSFNMPENEIVDKRNDEYSYVIKEINRMVDFFKSRKYGTFVDIIYIFGSGACLNDFKDILSEQLGIPTEFLPDIENGSTLSNENFQAMLSTLGSCIGG